MTTDQAVLVAAGAGLIIGSAVGCLVGLVRGARQTALALRTLQIVHEQHVRALVEALEAAREERDAVNFDNELLRQELGQEAK